MAPTAEDVESCPVNVNNMVATDDMHHIRSFNQSDSSSNLIKLPLACQQYCINLNNVHYIAQTFLKLTLCGTIYIHQ